MKKERGRTAGLLPAPLGGTKPPFSLIGDPIGYRVPLGFAGTCSTPETRPLV
jgi:hypothetical protein